MKREVCVTNFDGDGTPGDGGVAVSSWCDGDLDTRRLGKAQVSCRLQRVGGSRVKARRRQVQAQEGGAKRLWEKSMSRPETVPAKEYGVPKEHIWELQRILNGQKASFRKIHKTQAEANDKVWSLNENTEKALALLATCCERLEAANEDLCGIDHQFDVEFDQLEILAEKAAKAQREADQAMAQLIRTRNTYRTLATSFGEAEADLNQGLCNTHQMVTSTATATGALSCGTGDCMNAHL